MKRLFAFAAVALFLCAGFAEAAPRRARIVVVEPRPRPVVFVRERPANIVFVRSGIGLPVPLRTGVEFFTTPHSREDVILLRRR